MKKLLILIAIMSSGCGADIQFRDWVEANTNVYRCTFNVLGSSWWFDFHIDPGEGDIDKQVQEFENSNNIAGIPYECRLLIP